MCLPRHCQHHLLCGKLVQLCHLWLVVTGSGGNKEMATRKTLFHYWYLLWDLTLQLCNLTGQGCGQLIITDLLSSSPFLVSRQQSEVSTGSPFFQGRRAGCQSQRASRIPLRIHHRDLPRRLAGNVWTTWRTQLMTTPSLSPTTSSRSTAPSSMFLPAWPITTCYSEASPDSGRVKSFLMISEARGWNTCWVHSFIPQPAENDSQQELRIKKPG